MFTRSGNGKLSHLLLILASSAMLLQCSLFQKTPECDALQGTGLQNRKAIVFVHGFRGTCNETWDKFPSLLHADEELSSFDVFSWSYPSGLLGRQPSVKRIGQLLKTYLANNLSEYDEIYLISHSLGGLVVQHMIIDELQNGHASKLKRIKHIVFFGSPLRGHELNVLIRHLKSEYADIDFRSDLMSELQNKWNEHVYKPEIRPGDQNFKLKIPFTTVCGIEDEFIPNNECASIYRRLVETVRGNHAEMKNPKNQEADSYRVVKRQLLESAGRAMSPTQKGRTGIWVAQIRGDDDKHSAQREIARKLEFYLAKESSLKDVVEVHELAQEIIGSTEAEREVQARKLAQSVNATMVVWGEIAGLLNMDEFFPRITIGGTLKGIDSTISLNPVTAISRTQEYPILQAPQPYTLRTAPERVLEPIALTRYILAMQHYEKQEWPLAREHFEALLSRGVPQNVHNHDVHAFAGYSNFQLHFTSNQFANKQMEFMLKARGHFEDAKQYYDVSEKDSRYPFVLGMLALTHVILNAGGMDTSSFVPKPHTLFTKASQLWKELGDNGRYWTSQANLGATYRQMAIQGIDPKLNKQRAFDTLENLSADLKAHGTYDSVTENNLGIMYMEKASEAQVPDSIDFVQRAVAHFLIATNQNDNRKVWGTYVEGQRQLAAAYAKLIQFGIDQELNRSKCIEAWKELAGIYQENNLSREYAHTQLMIAQNYADAAFSEIDFTDNLGSAISYTKIAAANFKEVREWSKYYVAQNNLVVYYERLVLRKVNVSTNFMEMKRALEDGIEVFREYDIKDAETDFKKGLEQLDKLRRLVS